MKKALYVLATLSGLGLCYAGGYRFTLARVQSEGFVPFTMTLVTYLDGQPLVTQHIYRKPNSDRAEVDEQFGHDSTVVLHLLSTGHLVSLVPDRGIRTFYREETLKESLSHKQFILQRASSHCATDPSNSVDPTPVEVLGQLTYHVRSTMPCKNSDGSPCGRVMDGWHAPALGCQALKFTVGTDVVGKVTQLKIGEPDPAVFDEHPEFLLTPEKR